MLGRDIRNVKYVSILCWAHNKYCKHKTIWNIQIFKTSRCHVNDTWIWDNIMHHRISKVSNKKCNIYYQRERTEYFVWNWNGVDGWENYVQWKKTAFIRHPCNPFYFNSSPFPKLFWNNFFSAIPFKVDVFSLYFFRNICVFNK